MAGALLGVDLAEVEEGVGKIFSDRFSIITIQHNENSLYSRAVYRGRIA